MGQCIIKDCGFDNQKSNLSHNRKLRNFLAEVIKFLTNFENKAKSYFFIN